MNIHQLKASFLPSEDRVVLFINTRENDEIQLLITRRIAKNLLASCLKLLHKDPVVEQQQTESQKKAVLGFSRQESMSHVSTKQEFKNTPKNRPLGDSPLLIVRFSITQQGQAISIEFNGLSGTKIAFTLNTTTLHILFKLLEDIAKKAEWDIQSNIPDLDTSPSKAKH